LLSVVEDIEIPDSVALAEEILAREPYVRAQPENMKLQFIPYGFYSAEEYKAASNGQQTVIVMPDDMTMAPPTPKKRKKSKSVDAPSDAMNVDAQEETKEKPKKEKKEKKPKKEKKEKKSKKTKD
ncbi:hypothetical protein IW136_002701, partial [Coemansia sp. RSA 678]